MTDRATGRNPQQLTLILACLAQFMVILDVSVVNVALPAIRGALHFTEVDLQWVVNAYTVTMAGFLLLGGRASDLIGRRTVFVGGLLLFGLSSLIGGLAQDQGMLIAARALQGLGGAVIAPASLAILTTTFTEPAERNRAVGIWGAMGGAGGAAGVLLGGVLTSSLSWRWILFINVPIALTVAFLTHRAVAEGRSEAGHRDFDISGALTATVGLSLLVLGIVRTDAVGWGSAQALGLMAGGLVLIAIFLLIESRFAAHPLMPLRIYRNRTLSTANLVVLTTGAATFAMWFFLSLYLQQVLGYSAIRAGLAFLPMTLCIVASSQIASRLVQRTGAKTLLVVGMSLQGAGLLLLSGMTADGTYVGDVLAGSLLIALGIGFAFVTGAIAATQGVAPTEAGLASALVNSSRLFGAALGLAVLAALAASRSRSEATSLSLAGHHGVLAAHEALVSGFQLALVLAGVTALVGAVTAAVGLPARITPRPREMTPAPVIVE